MCVAEILEEKTDYEHWKRLKNRAKREEKIKDCSESNDNKKEKIDNQGEKKRDNERRTEEILSRNGKKVLPEGMKVRILIKKECKEDRWWTYHPSRHTEKHSHTHEYTYTVHKWLLHTFFIFIQLLVYPLFIQ